MELKLAARRHTGHLTIQARIALLVLACIVPSALLAVYVIYLSYDRERANIEQHALDTTRALLRAVERDLAADQAALQTLAVSSRIDAGDFAAFYGQAKEVLSYTSGFTVVLSDASGQQVINLLQPFGAPLPRHGNPELLRRVLESGEAAVSDLFVGGVTKKPVVSIEVPVVREGKVLYLLDLGIDPAHMGEIMRRQGLQSDWVISIFDSTGTIIARSHAGEQFVGKKGSAPLLERMRQVPEGVISAPTLEGIPVLAAFSRSPAYGWSVAIGVPEAVVTADLKRWLMLYTTGAGLLLLAGLAMAIVIGRGIARPILELTAPALAIAKGESVSVSPLDLKEAEEVRQALLQAQHLLQQREHERDQAEKAEREMLLAKQAAEQANKAKAAFLANISHELRTPLNAILGFSRLVRNAPGIPAEQIKNLDIVNRSGEHLLTLINNVLDMSRIESGHVELKEVSIDLGRVLQEVQSLMQARAVEKGLVFETQNASTLPRRVTVDADKLRQVLINLVGNAIKFAQRGAVVLRARVTRQEPLQAWVRFEVEDSGPGISEADRARIFSPFVQLGEQRTDAGTGLGLVISKQYVELMGGQIDVASEPGKGSVFYFEIPVRLGSQSEEVDENPRRGRMAGLAPGQKAHRLLIAEDQPENRLLLRKLLEPLGFDLREAEDGAQAMAQFEQWHPQLIFMDIGMPKSDGLQVIRQIRSSPAGADTKIVAVTAHVFDDERNQILAAGCDGFIRKPYAETDIFDALEKHLRVRFLYEEIRPSTAVDGEVSVAQLRKLPADVLEELRHAAVLLDGQRCLEIAGRICAIDKLLGARLQRMVDNLQYKELLALVEGLA
jgi:signal transduction histidine kinase/DNA-binding NarL/FixJ family response regulator